MDKRAVVMLKKEDKGWILYLEEGDIDVLDRLYGTSYERMEESKRYFRQDDDWGEVSLFLEEIATGLGYDVEFTPQNAIILTERKKPIHVSVDFKWSLWMGSSWEEFDEEKAFQLAKTAFEGQGADVIIQTAPRKEIRYGQVCITKGQADVKFFAVWDAPSDLIPENCSENHRDQVKEWIESYFAYGEGFYDYGENPIGASVVDKVTAITFEELLYKIDQLEEELIDLEKRNSKTFHELLDSYIKQL